MKLSEVLIALEEGKRVLCSDGNSSTVLEMIGDTIYNQAGEVVNLINTNYTYNIYVENLGWVINTKNQEHCYISIGLEVRETFGEPEQKELYSGTAFTDRKLADWMAKRAQLLFRMQRFALEHNKWGDSILSTYVIRMNRGVPSIDTWAAYRPMLDVMFSSREVAEKALNTFKHEIEAMQSLTPESMGGLYVQD